MAVGFLDIVLKIPETFSEQVPLFFAVGFVNKDLFLVFYFKVQKVTTTIWFSNL